VGTSFTIDVGDGDTVTALRYAVPRAKKAGAPVLVLAHGAGAPQSHPFMVEMATGLAARGVTTITFDFVYTEKKRKLPDKAPRLESCWRAVLGAVRAKEKKSGAAILIGGKSMGGRIASMIAPTEVGLAGLVFLGYPLHPPGNPAKLRAAHLPSVKAKMLFVQGEKDAFGTPAELAPILKKLPAKVVVVKGGDHSFKVPKRGGVSQADTMARVMDEVAAFARTCAGGAA
jgi:uncharacterized protein